MWICKDCGERFNNPATRAEYRGEGAYEYYGCCPSCESENYEETAICAECGKEVGESELTEGLCADCEKAVQDKVTSLFRSLTPAQRNYLTDSEWLYDPSNY